jgi:predicted AAA+ superfamily ATPase
LHGYIPRRIETAISRALSRSPAVAILGPRQCGKSTTAKQFLEKTPSVYLDLQDRADRNKLTEPELFFDRYRDKLIETYGGLLAHPAAGASWEGFVIENLIAENDRWQPSFLRTSNGAEADLVLERGGRRHLLECKLSKAPKPSRGFHELMASLAVESAWIVAPVDEPYEIGKGVFVCPPGKLDLEATP